MVIFVYKPVYNDPYKFMTNGSFWYIFEYFLKTYELNKQTKLVFVSSKKFDIGSLREYLDFKYTVNIPYDNITVLNYYELINYVKLTPVVVLDIETYSDEYVEKILRDKYTCLLYTSNFNKLMKNRYYKENIFHFAEDERYIKKIYFEALRIPERVDEGVYVNLRGKRAVSIEQFNEKIKPILDKIDKRKLILVDNINSLFSKYLNHININTFDCILYDIQYRFDTYVDCMLNNYDYAPRMILESFYFNKSIIYIDNNLNDNAKKRYVNVKSGDISKYILTSDDDLIRMCLNYV